MSHFFIGVAVLEFVIQQKSNFLQRNLFKIVIKTNSKVK